MAKIKKVFKAGFTTVSNDFLKDINLGMKERGLLVTMLSLPDNWEFSVSGLSAILPNSKNGVGLVLKHLEEHGYLQRNKIRTEKGVFVDTEYIFSDSKLTKKPLNSPHLQNRDMDNRDMDSPYMENEAQLNTNKETTNELNTNKELDSRGPKSIYEIPFTKEQEKDINRLIQAIGAKEIHASKESLYKYLLKLYKNNFKDSYGKPIDSLFGYVKSNFLIKTKNDEKKKEEKQLEKPVAHFPDYDNMDNKLFVSREEARKAIRARKEKHEEFVN